MKTTCLPNDTITAKSSRPMRQLCGLAIAALAAIGLSAPLASAVTVPVDNGGFETEFGTNTDSSTNWVKITNWTFNNTNTAILPIGTAFTTDASGAGSGNYTRFTYNTAGIEQNLNTTVSSGETISVSFSVGSNATTEANFTVNPARVRGYAYFLVGSTRYDMPFNLAATPTNGVWVPMTFTTTVNNTGNLTLGFQNYRDSDPGSNNSYYTSLDGVSDVTLTPAANDPNAPTSTNATLAALENTATPLAAGDFGYADPNSSALAAVQITAVPTLGTLTYNGSPVANNDIIAAADIGNLSYLSPLGGFGSPYTTIGIKVQNSALLWSLPAVMTVNVTDVNHAPTSSGGSVVLRKNTVKTFAATDFPFSDVDAGDTLQAIKVTSLPNPLNGTLTLNGTPITSAPSADILVADIGTLTYTPSTDYTGSDPFNFQVRDAALFSADATMALTVTADIPVLNGDFATPVPVWIGPGAIQYANTATQPWSDGLWSRILSPWTNNMGNYARIQQSSIRVTGSVSNPNPVFGPWMANMNDPGYDVLTQDLNTTVNAGDTLAVTFQTYRTLGGGIVRVSFLVGSTTYSKDIDTTTDHPQNTFVNETFTQTVGTGVSGNLSIQFSNVSGQAGFVANVSNVSQTTGGGPIPGSFADWALTNAPGQNPSQDYNNDGVQNGVAYFMGVTGLATNPGLDASNTVTWPKSATYQGTFVVQTSPDLGTWTPADPQPTPSGGNLTYLLPPGAPGGKSFVRLLVTPD